VAVRLELCREPAIEDHHPTMAGGHASRPVTRDISAERPGGSPGTGRPGRGAP
jgi:hypothetical protein